MLRFAGLFNGIDVCFTSCDFYDKQEANIPIEDYRKTLPQCRDYDVKAHLD